MNLIIYGALFTDNVSGSCKTAGVAFEVKHKEVEGVFDDISTDRTYGDLWLSNLHKLITNFNKAGYLTEVKQIKLVTGQPQTEKMGKKIERILTEAIQKEMVSREDVERLVFKDGRYTPRPNNHLYTDVVFLLANLCKSNHIYFAHQHMPCSHTMDLVKGLHKKIAPTKVLIDKTKPKRAKAPL